MPGAVKLGRWGSMIDTALADDVAKLSVAATACLVAFIYLRKRRILGEKRAAARAAPPSLEPPAGWPNIPGMQCGNLTNPQGVLLRTFRFDADSPKAAVILVHGIGVGCRHEFLRATHDGGPHSVYKDSLIDVLQRAGISVFTYDQQSLGNSDSVLPDTRCYFHKFDDLAIDLLSVHAHFAASLPPGTPIFWLGISLGGGVATRAVQLRPKQPTPLPPVQGLLLLAPMISLTKVRQEYFFKPLGLRNQHLYGVMHQLSALIPTVPMAKRARNEVHPHVEEELENELTNWTKPIRIRVATEVTIITESFMSFGQDASIDSVAVPSLLCIHAKADTFVEPQGSVALFERANVAGPRALVLMGGGKDGLKGEVWAKGPETAAKALAKITDLGMWHGLACEPRCEEVAAAVAAWVIAVSAAK